MSQLKKNMLSGGIFAAGNIILTILAYPIYLKSLGAEIYGLWATLSVILSFNDLGQLGIGTAIMKYIASAYEKRDYDSIAEYVSTAFCILFVPSVIIMAILFFFRVNIAEILTIKKVFGKLGIDLIFYVGFLSVMSFFVNTIRGVVAGIGRIDIANYVFLISRILQLALTVFFFSLNIGILSLYWAYLLYLLFPSIIWIYILKKDYKINLFKFSKFRYKKFQELIRYGSVYVAGLSAGMLVVPFNKIIIARYIGFAEVTYYQIAVQSVLSLRNIYFKGLEAILPKISAVAESKQGYQSMVFNYYNKGVKYIVFYGIPIFMLTFMFSNDILKLWLKSEYNINILYAFRILLVGWTFNLVAAPDYFMFLGLGKVKYTTIEEWLRAGINVILVVMFIKIGFKSSLSSYAIINTVALIIGSFYFKYKSRCLIANKKPVSSRDY